MKITNNSQQVSKINLIDKSLFFKLADTYSQQDIPTTLVQNNSFLSYPVDTLI